MSQSLVTKYEGTMKLKLISELKSGLLILCTGAILHN